MMFLRTCPSRFLPKRRPAPGVRLLASIMTLLCTLSGTVDADAPEAIVGPVTATGPVPTTRPLTTPVEYRSKNGRLDVTLKAQQTRVRLGATDIDGATYNGLYGGPVIRVRPGDFLHVQLVNELPQPTNIHFHGLNVSPQGHGDNSSHMVQPGDSWDYEIAIPKDHPPGAYWFHTHAHQAAERQLMGGLSGTLVVEGFQEQVPTTLPLKERLFALKEFSPDSRGRLNRVPKPYQVVIKSINGEVMPQIDIAPGESQLWRFSDQTANTYFRLSLAGHQFMIVGRDGQPLVQPEVVKLLTFGPSQRIDAIVTAAPAGRYELVAETTSTGPIGDMSRAQPMALLVSASRGGEAPPPKLGPYVVAGAMPVPVPDARIDAHRIVTFSEDVVTGLFFINHETFDPKKVAFKVPLGSIEEWTVRNSSEELHVFHLHQVHFQVASINGRTVPFTSLVDTVSVPIHGEVKIRVAFTDPAIVGRFMYHCHIVEHEDKGMMAQMEVFDPTKGPMEEEGSVNVAMHGHGAAMASSDKTAGVGISSHVEEH